MEILSGQFNIPVQLRPRWAAEAQIISEIGRYISPHRATPHSGTKWLLCSNGLNLMPTLLHTFTFFANINCICPVSNYFLLYLHIMWDFQYVFNCLFVFNNVFAQPFSFTMVIELEDTLETHIQRDIRLNICKFILLYLLTI